MKSFVLLLAQGFGSGRIPFAPGTFGSVVGLLWFYLLMLPGSPGIFLAGVILGIPLSVWVCAEGEKILGKKDPGSVVMDEIIAIPMSFLSWVAIVYFTKKGWPMAGYFFQTKYLLATTLVFLLFRLFDITKPWPAGQSQNLPGGWGVTMDDVWAAVYVNLAIYLIWFIKPEWF